MNTLLLAALAVRVAIPGWQTELDLPGLLTQFISLAGFAALAAALINAGKAAGLVKDGQAANYSLLINLVGFIVLVLLRVFRPDADIKSVDSVVAVVSQILAYILGLILQFSSSKVANSGLRGLPVIGFSYSHKE